MTRVYDAWGSSEAYDNSGNVITPFDDIPDALIAHASMFGYRNQLHDLATGEIYMRHRQVIPELGIFTTPDPLGENGGTYGLYSYVSGDPVQWQDFSGLTAEEGGWFSSLSSFFSGLLPNHAAQRTDGTHMPHYVHRIGPNPETSGLERIEAMIQPTGMDFLGTDAGTALATLPVTGPVAVYGGINAAPVVAYEGAALYTNASQLAQQLMLAAGGSLWLKGQELFHLASKQLDKLNSLTTRAQFEIYNAARIGQDYLNLETGKSFQLYNRLAVASTTVVSVAGVRSDLNSYFSGDMSGVKVFENAGKRVVVTYVTALTANRIVHQRTDPTRTFSNLQQSMGGVPLATQLQMAAKGGAVNASVYFANEGAFGFSNTTQDTVANFIFNFLAGAGASRITYGNVSAGTPLLRGYPATNPIKGEAVSGTASGALNTIYLYIMGK